MNALGDYHAFLERKRITDPDTGITADQALPAFLFPHQADIVRWALRRGRAAVFAGTGLGKTIIELLWSDAVVRHTNKPVLIIAPLAVSVQHIREAEKFGLQAIIARADIDCDQPAVYVTNYQKLEHFDLRRRFGGVVLDESSILKSHDGKTRTKLIQACQPIPFRLAATATPAPNDFMELGNHAEFLGVMSYTDMLATFFVHDGGSTQSWRLKGHAENEFWRWMASWSVMLRKPSDLGYPDEGYELPPLHQHQHVVPVEYAPSLDTGLLFPLEARGMRERISARKDTVDERVTFAVSLIISSFRTKLAECEHQKKTASTCEPIIAPISGGLNEPLSKRRSVRLAEESDTQQTQNIESDAKLMPNGVVQKNAAKHNCDLLLASVSINTMLSSANKAADAPSVEQALEQLQEESASMSTIATMEDTSEDFSAQIAIKDLESLEIMPTGLLVQSSIFGKLVVEPWVIWCHLNSEQDALAKEFGDLAISISGRHGDIEKEILHERWIAGKAPILLTKPSMFGHGLNWQHCNNCIFVGLNDSFESVFQAIRRFWRFGQTKPVHAHFIAAETEGAVVANLKRKEADAERMMSAMVRHMSDLSSAAVRGAARDRPDYDPQIPMEIPAWL